MSRLLLSAALALAFLGITAHAQAQQYSPQRRAHHHTYAQAPHSYGFFSFGYPEYYPYRPIGGHSYYWQHRAWPFVHGPAYNYPGFYNNQTFWERVQTQPNYPVQY